MIRWPRRWPPPRSRVCRYNPHRHRRRATPAQRLLDAIDALRLVILRIASRSSGSCGQLVFDLRQLSIHFPGSLEQQLWVRDLDGKGHAVFHGEISVLVGHRLSLSRFDDPAAFQIFRRGERGLADRDPLALRDNCLLELAGQLKDRRVQIRSSKIRALGRS